MHDLDLVPARAGMARRSRQTGAGKAGIFDTYADSFAAIWKSAVPLRQEG
ncbi:hypothetical protein H8N00_25420 [Streptomyces sp. AC563]|nr:hypothetical protein [Streptomyces buecherae]MBC3992158.1 hypothetical protein [Streptomyces buecherae]